MKHSGKFIIMAVLALLFAALSPGTASAQQTLPTAEAAAVAPGTGPSPDDVIVSPQSAFGGTPIGSFPYSVGGVSFNVPAGCFFNHKIDGQRLGVSRDFAGVDCVGALAAHPGLFCNTQTRFDYYTAASPNKPWKSVKSPLVSGCRTIISNMDAPGTPYGVRTGKACASFLVNGVVRATQCHSVFP